MKRSAGLAAAAVTAAVVLHSSAAEAQSGCYTEECVYVLPVAAAIGGLTTIVGGMGSIWDPDPEPAWYTIGYTMSVMNVISGSIMALIGGLDEDDDSESEFHFIAGTTQIGIGVVSLVIAALAEGHYKAIEQVKATQAKLLVLPLATEPTTPVPTGLALTAQF